MIQIEIFTLCDSVEVYGGKAVVCGAYNVVKATTFPCKVRQLALAFRFSYEKEDVGEKSFKFRFLTPEGKDLIPPLKCDANLKITTDKLPIATCDMNIVANNVDFVVPGIYKILVTSEGKEYVYNYSVIDIQKTDKVA